MRDQIRLMGFVVAAIVSVVAFIALTPNVQTSTPTLPSATRYESLITEALDADRLNNLSTESAPQQQVVNGWTARDLLTIIAKENIDILRAQGAVVDATGTLQTTPFDNRVPALLLIALLTLCWHGITAPRNRVSQAHGPGTAAQLPSLA